MKRGYFPADCELGSLSLKRFIKVGEKIDKS